MRHVGRRTAGRLRVPAWMLVLTALLLGGLRPACPMHAATTGASHHQHGPATPTPVPCSCIGDCVVPVVPTLERPPVLPAAPLVSQATTSPRAPLGVREVRPSQLRLPFATAPPVA